MRCPVERAKADPAPATLIGRFEGTAQAFQSSIAGMGIDRARDRDDLPVLGVLYESAWHLLRFSRRAASAALRCVVG
jgi:hypothetical protein